MFFNNILKNIFYIYIYNFYSVEYTVDKLPFTRSNYICNADKFSSKCCLSLIKLLINVL